jgi:hypothetical protein
VPDNDDDLEAAVEAEWQAASERANAAARAGIFALVESRKSIRKRLQRERLEAEEAELRHLVLERERDEAERWNASAEPEQTTLAHEGGAPEKEWPRLALVEAVRMWQTRAHNGSQREIARQVTKKVREKIDEAELEQHKFETFTRPAMKLVVVAVKNGWLEWDSVKGLGVFGQFSTKPEWLPIPHRKPAP